MLTSTFHGRDLFAPAAAHLALGVPLDEIGPPIDPAELVSIGWPSPVAREGELETSVIYRDTFGNLKLAGPDGTTSTPPWTGWRTASG